MNKSLDEEVVLKVKEYIRTNSRYKLLDYVLEHVTKEVDESNFNPKIKCPFHGRDNTPSCYIRLEVNGFKCFGCGEGGDFTKFVTLFNQKHNNMNVSYYVTMDRLLQDDPRMKLDVGANTIFKFREMTVEQAVELPVFLFKPRQTKTLDSLMELKRWMGKTSNLDNDSIKIAIISAQQGLPPEDIKSIILGEVNNNIIIPDMSNVNLDDILGDYRMVME